MLKMRDLVEPDSVLDERTKPGCQLRSLCHSRWKSPTKRLWRRYASPTEARAGVWIPRTLCSRTWES